MTLSPSTPIDVQLGAMLFDCETVDADGIRWHSTEWPGWESPEPAQQWGAKAGQSGVFPESSLYGGRAIVFKGAAEMVTKAVPFEQSYEKAERKLAAATDLVETVPALFIVGELPVPKQALVYRAGRLRHRPEVKRRVMVFEVPLLAPDYRKYATTTTAIAAGVVANVGTKLSTPVVTVTGAAAGPVRVTNATDNAKYVQVNTALAGGQVLTIDMEEWSASIDGVNADALIDAGSRWWDVLPGNNTLSLTGGGTLGGSFRAAYI